MTSPLAQFERDEPSAIGRSLERLALLIALAVVIARCTMLESIRDALDVSPGAEVAPPRGPGATTAIVLSLLATLPALLVLLRRMIDPTFVMGRSLAITGLLLLAGWAVVSTFWAADKFLAIVSAVNWLAAFTLAWAVAQLVRTSRRQRIVAGVGMGLLLVFLVHAGLYLQNDLPALRETVERDKDKILAERGWTADSFEARQFLQKITNGEMAGFNASANTFGALLVVTMILTAGVALQRRSDGDPPAWLGVFAVPIVLGVAVIYRTNSRAAFGMLALATGAHVSIALVGPTLRRFRKSFLALAIVAFLAGAAVVVWRGATGQDLFHDSLNFRLRYWIGSWHVFTEHPIVGVGWENFSAYYLGHRLPIASEEIRDPHNFIVRVFTELGLVGGLLLAFAVARLVGEATRATNGNVTPSNAARALVREPEQQSLKSVLAAPVVIALAGMAINAMASIDTAQAFDYVDLEFRKRLLMAVVMAIGITAAVIGRSTDDERPTPWLGVGFALATLLLLVQNLIDFSMFEPSGMFLFATIAGAAVGSGKDFSTTFALKPASFGRRAIAPVVMAVVWLVVAFGLALPVGLAESDAFAGAELRRARRGDRAADAYASAAQRVPYNYDYAFETARALLESGAPSTASRAWLDRAIATAGGMSLKTWLLSARVEASQQSPDVARLRKAYDAAIAVDPQSVSTRLEYADVLEKLGLPKDAASQMRLALAANAGLDPNEPKRLPPALVAEVERRAAGLER